MTYLLRCSAGSLKVTDENNATVGEYCNYVTGKDVFVGGNHVVITLQTTSPSRFNFGGFRLYFSAVQPSKFKTLCNFSFIKRKLNGLYPLT